MAFAITNFTNPFPTAMWDTGTTVKKQNADVTNVTNAQTCVDLGSASFSAMRVIFYGKTMGTLSTGDVMTFTVQVGTGAALTSPVNIIQKAITVLSTDTAFCFEVMGIAPSLFESYTVTFVTSSNHTLTYDYQVEVC